MTLWKPLTIVLAGAAAWGPCAPAVADGLPAGAGAERRVAASSAVAFERGMPTGTLHLTDPGSSLFAGSDPGISAVGGAAPPGGTLAELSSARNSPYPERLSAAESGSRRGAQPPSVIAMAGAPSGTLALLCGLVIVVYVARRRMG
jgi:hypothetical protein